jgi:AraC-like DNA-binding protein
VITCAKRGTFCDNPEPRTLVYAHMPIIRDIIYGASGRGASIAELCKRTGIEVTHLNDSDRRLDFASSYEVWEQAVKLTCDKLLGLHLGESTNPTILGLVGHLMQSSPTLKEAFVNVTKYSKTATDMFQYSIHKNSGKIILQFEPAGLWMKQSPDSARHAVEQAMAGTLNVFYLLSGNRIFPMEANFQHRRPAPVGEYERVFKSIIQFNSTSNQLIFDEPQLDRTILSNDLSLYQSFEKMLVEKGRKQRESESFIEKLISIILTVFKGQVPSVEVLASFTGLTTRSLQRKLKSEGSSYRELSVKIKMDLARQMLSKPESKVGYIANVLGYSEASAFRRAYKSWTNTSPRKQRKS